MWFLMIGLAMLVGWYLEIGFLGTLAWWWVALPFAAAVAWWSWADSSGYSKRKAMERFDRRKEERIAKQKEALGTLPRHRR